MTDTATLSGGYYETGTITFTLYLGTTLVDTESVAVNGNGTYSTPTGYTLPTTGTVTGTYQWDRHLQRRPKTSRPATVMPRPSRRSSTRPAPDHHDVQRRRDHARARTVPVPLTDTATLSGGYYESGSITFTLYLGSTLVDTER